MAGMEPPSPPSRAGYAIRASLACVPCRNRHRKCDAHRPSCFQCQAEDGDCFYKQSRRGRSVQTVQEPDMEHSKSPKVTIRKKKRVSGDENVDQIPEFSTGSSFASQVAPNTLWELSIEPTSTNNSQTALEHGHAALSDAHADSNYVLSQGSTSFDWVGSVDMLANSDVRMPDYDPKTYFTCTTIDELDESNIFEITETSQMSLFSEMQGYNSFDTTYPIRSISREEQLLVCVDDSTPQLSSMNNMNFNRAQPIHLGRSLGFPLNQIAVISAPLHVDFKPSDNGRTEMPLIVYGYGSWTATASNGSIELSSLAYGFQDGRGGQKPTHIARYQDEAFPSAGYFYRPPASQDGAHWLVPLLKRSEPLYHACVSLGLCHQLLGKENTRECQLDFSNELRKHHTSSLKGLQERIDTLPAYHDEGFITAALDLLACIWQLLSIECWRTTEGYWEMHWTALGTILSIMQPGYTKKHSLLRTHSGSKPYTSSQKPSFIDDALRQYPMSTDSVVLKYYVQTYAWTDILACATFGLRRPFANPFQYLRLLEDGKLDLCSLMGCYNEVMTAILKIAIIKNWKEAMQNSARLSFRELIKKSNHLEKDLNHELLKLLEERRHFTQQPEVDRSFVTEVYIRSALIYLHTVVSGPSVEIPEVRENVEKALDALLILPYRLVLRISWPFCIAACMAVDQEQDQFRKIASNAIQAGYLIGTVTKGIKIAEECWRIRASSPLSLEGVDWTSAMKSLGVRVLLI